MVSPCTHVTVIVAVSEPGPVWSLVTVSVTVHVMFVSFFEVSIIAPGPTEIFHDGPGSVIVSCGWPLSQSSVHKFLSECEVHASVGICV